MAFNKTKCVMQIVSLVSGLGFLLYAKSPS